MSDIYTIKGRLEEVNRAVVLMSASLQALRRDGDEDMMNEVSRADIVDALTATASDASAHLYWLSLLPENVLAAPAPDDDDANELANAPTSAGPEETQANRRQMVEGAIRRHFLPAMPATEGRAVRNIGKPVVDLTHDDREGA